MRWLGALGIVWFIGLCACSGGSDAAGPTPPPSPQVGRISLENRTAFAVTATYVDRRDSLGAQLVRTRVAAGQRSQLGQDALPVGLELEIDLVVEVPPGQGFRVRRKVLVQVEGDTSVVVEQPDEADLFSIVARLAAS